MPSDPSEFDPEYELRSAIILEDEGTKYCHAVTTERNENDRLQDVTVCGVPLGRESRRDIQQRKRLMDQDPVLCTDCWPASILE